MADRVVPLAELRTEIANRAELRGRSVADCFPGMEATLGTKVRRRATEMLKQGRHRAAVTLCEFAHRQHPDDPQVVNDLGFCLIPIDPRAALNYLTLANSLGCPPASVNLYNRALCHFLLGCS